MDRRSFISKCTAMLVTVGVIAVAPHTIEQGESLKYSNMANKLPGGYIPTSNDFAKILDSGHEQFIIAFQAHHKIVMEDAPFDLEDPMSYALAELIMQNPMLRIYKAKDDNIPRDDRKTHDEMIKNIIPFIHHV